MNGIHPWIPVEPPKEQAYFGLDRTRPAFGVPIKYPGRLRCWLGYRLYAVVYWLLGGHP